MYRQQCISSWKPSAVSIQITDLLLSLSIMTSLSMEMVFCAISLFSPPYILEGVFVLISGTGPAEIITGDRLSDFENLLELGTVYGSTNCKTSAKKATASLVQKVNTSEKEEGVSLYTH